MRYLTPLIPFLFVMVAGVLIRMPPGVAAFLAVLSVTQAWCMAMYRDVERGAGLLEPVLQVFLGGFQLPSLTVLSRVGKWEYFERGISPLPLFAFAAALLFLLWSPRFRVVRTEAAGSTSL